MILAKLRHVLHIFLFLSPFLGNGFLMVQNVEDGGKLLRTFDLVKSGCEIDNRLLIIVLGLLWTLFVLEFPIKDHLSVSCSLCEAHVFYLIEHFWLKLSTTVIIDRLNQLDLGNFAESVAVPSVAFKSLFHVVFKPSSLHCFPEISQRVSRSLRQDLFPFDLHPEWGTLGLGFVLKSNLEHFDGFSDGVPHVRFDTECQFLSFVMVIRESEVINWVQKHPSFHGISNPTSLINVSDEKVWSR